MIDITAPDIVEIEINDNGNIVWVHTAGGFLSVQPTPVKHGNFVPVGPLEEVTQLRAWHIKQLVITDGRKKTSEDRVQNNDGEWVPSIPEPLWTGLLRMKCCQCLFANASTGAVCRRVFKDKETYMGHFALVHILKLGGSQ